VIVNGATHSARAAELKRFLRAVRSRIEPDEAGVPLSERRRRAAGLRIEEVASLAEVGITWYSALESGRGVRVSAKLLERVASALRMSAAERDHLFALALPRSEVAAPRGGGGPFAAVIDGFTIGPAFVCDRFWNVGACNRLAALVYGHDRARERNLLARMLFEPEFRSLHEDWQSVAREMVDILHLAHGRAPDDPAALELIERLEAQSPEFVAWWSAYRLSDYEPKAGVIVHPVFGRLSLLFTSFVASSLTKGEEQSMLLLQPPTDEATRERLQRALESPG